MGEGVGGEGGHASGTTTSLTTGKQPEVIEFSRMVNILVIHAQSEHVTLQVKIFEQKSYHNHNYYSKIPPEK